MRRRRSAGGVSVHAVSGTYVVTLGMNATSRAARNLLGFAIHRTDHTENEWYWLNGFKTFRELNPYPVPGALYPSITAPVQTFLWADYTAKTDHEYTYKVVPLYGSPRSIREGRSVSVKIGTESHDDGRHAIYFNRGVAASQAYTSRFGLRSPDAVGAEAFTWLSRGLLEGLLDFIKQARGRRYGLYASVYEFNYAPVLQAFKAASNRGAEVRIVYDARKENPRESNEAAIRSNGIRRLVIPRREGRSYISHNKFIILTHNRQPVQIWTGSTNITKGGIFGQANVGHIVRKEAVARQYMAYWKQLASDPPTRDLRVWINTNSPTPDPADTRLLRGTDTLFSPRRDGNLDSLQWYANLMDEAQETVALTAAFGVNPVLASVLAKDKDYLRYLILERRGSNYDTFSRDRDVRIAIGARFKRSVLERWTSERLTNYNLHVKYIHTKVLMVDFLTEAPTVITGSANFSKNSTVNNDENMLIIHRNKRVADIYLGEFFRLFNHFYFRYVMNSIMARGGTGGRQPAFLKSDDSWTEKYYRRGSIKKKQRELFA